MSRGAAIGLAVLMLLVGVGVGWFVRTPSSTAPPAPDNVLERIYQRGYMIVGTDAAFPPFENVNSTTAEIEGFDIDLINEIAEILGVGIEVRNTGWDPLFVQIPDKSLDLGISAMTITAERNATLLFSDPYFYSDLSIVIRTGGPMAGIITNASTLDGRRIAVQRETTGEAWVDDTLVADMGINPSEIRRTTLYTDAIALLSSDEVDAVIIDKPVGEGYENAGVVTLVETIVTNETYGIPMPRGEIALKGAIDAALSQIRETGVYDDLIEKWFVG